MNNVINTHQAAIESVFQGFYTDVKFLGKGSFSKVYKCLDSRSNKFVAIKVIDLSELQAEIIPYMENEVALLAKSQNENVIKLIEHKRTSESIFLVLEFCYLDVSLMATKYFEKKVPEDLVIVIFRQLANGLHYLHNNHIIHRDLKLENFAITMTPEDYDSLTNRKDVSVLKRAQYKLIDLGLSKQLSSSNMTTNTWAGSELNMAPEILEEHEYSLKADIYSFGVCIYLMVTGKFPFHDLTMRTSILQLIKEGNAQYNLIQNPQLRQLVSKMLKYSPEERLDWEELYQHPFLKNEIDQTLTPLDLQLQQNSRIYVRIKKMQMDAQDDSKSKIFTQQQIIKCQQIDVNDQLEQQVGGSTPNSNYKSLIYQPYLWSPRQSDMFNLYQPTEKEKEEIKKCLFMRNKSILSQKTAFNLQETIQELKQSYQQLHYRSMEAEYFLYIDYLYQLAEKIMHELKQKLRLMEQRFSQYPDFQMLKEQSKLNQNILPQRNESYISTVALYCRYIKKVQLLEINNQDFDLNNESVNIEMYKLILRMLQDIFFKNATIEDLSYNRIKCLLYINLISIARLRATFQGKLKEEDQKGEEVEIKYFENEPDILSTKITTILDKYQLNYS